MRASVNSPAKIVPRGLRERKKAARRDSIKAAARDLFYSKGYEATTTLEIASRARIAEGTLFLYAPNKQDLLLMLVNDDMEALTSRAAANLDDDELLLKQVMALFGARYIYWAKYPDISRQTMQAAMSHRVQLSPSPEMQRYDQTREMLARNIIDVVQKQQALGLLRTTEDPETIATMLVAIFVAEVRSWLVNPKPLVKPGLARLERLLKLALSGVTIDRGLP